MLKILGQTLKIPLYPEKNSEFVGLGFQVVVASQQPTSSLTQILSSSLTSLDQFTPDLKGLDTKGRMLQIE